MNLKDFENLKDKLIEQALEMANTFPGKKNEIKVNIKYLKNLDEMIDSIRNVYQKK